MTVAAVFKRARRARRVRSKISKVSRNHLRLSVFRSNNHFYAQLIDDSCGFTLLSVSTRDRDFDYNSSSVRRIINRDVAKHLGEKMAKKILDNDVVKGIVFDRGGFSYSGVVKCFADSLRECGVVL